MRITIARNEAKKRKLAGRWAWKIEDKSGDSKAIEAIMQFGENDIVVANDGGFYGCHGAVLGIGIVAMATMIVLMLMVLRVIVIVVADLTAIDNDTANTITLAIAIIAGQDANR